MLNSDPDTGIIGDSKDIARRHVLFGKHHIALPQIQSFFTILARNFEDVNVIYLIWAATVYLLISMFNASTQVYIEALTIYSGLLFSALISATCDYIKEKQNLKLKDEVNN